jgi:glucokinase
MSDLWLGVDVGGTKTLACLVAGNGEVRAREVVDTVVSSPRDLLEWIGVWDRRVAADHSRLRGVGVGLPGLVDGSGVLRSSVIVPKWAGLDVAAEARKRLGLPAVADNDANLAAVAEAAARPETRDFLFASVGTGIGGAVVIGAEVHRGARGFAGELGHVAVDPDGASCGCGRRGCVGVMASGGGIESRAGLRRGELAAALERGDPDARRALAESCRVLGAALADAVHLFDFELVVLGGGVANLGTFYVEEVARSVRREVFEDQRDLRVEAARTGYDAGALGAARYARERLGADQR